MDGRDGINGLAVFGHGTFPALIEVRGVGNVMVGALVEGEGGNGKSNLSPPSGKGGSE